MDDRSVVAAQIGRRPRSRIEVATRCSLGLPVVTVVPPILDDQTPFPTTYWLGCPLAVRRISRLESSGAIAELDERTAVDAAFAARLEAANERYARDRDAMIPEHHRGPVPTGGVAGSHGGVKCLHAHYADHAAGNDNPVGAWVAERIGTIACTIPCVVDVDGTVVANPAWREPR